MRRAALPLLSLLVAACDDGSTDGPGGGGGAGGIGEPSAVYPAPHGDPPQVQDSGGPIFAAPTMVPVVFQGDDPATVATIVDLGAKVGPSDYWKATTAEYGVGPLALHATAEVPEPAPKKISPQEIEAWLIARLDAGDPSLPAPFEGAIYMLYYPAGTSIDDGVSASCTSYSGYHSSVTLGAAHGHRNVAYAVVPRCAEFYGRSALDTLTSTTTHELIEAATDPFPFVAPAYFSVDAAHAYWPFVFGGGEVSDMCNLPAEANAPLPGTPYQVQRSWSNAAALAGRDPCVPALAGRVYFNASPDLPDDIPVGGQITKGIRIAAGAKRTVGLRLFSEGPTAPLSVIVEDWAKLTGGAAQLAFSLDETTGLNGQTLHLTIEVVGEDNTQLLRISTTDGTQWTSWIALVGR